MNQLQSTDLFLCTAHCQIGDLLYLGRLSLDAGREALIELRRLAAETHNIRPYFRPEN